MACYYQSIGSSVYKRLIEIFEKFGYYVEKSVSIFYSGLDGMDKMKKIMDFAREGKLDAIANAKVLAKNDLVARIKTYADGKTEAIDLPKTNAIKWNLENGDWVCVRPSGTEPKLKIYVATKADSKDKATLVAEGYVDFMKNYLA